MTAPALTSCGPLSDYIGHAPAATPAAPPPPDNNGAPALYDPNAAAPPPPGGTAQLPLPGQSGTGTMPNGLPALPPHGVDLKKQFSEDIKDPIERIKRVENAVVELRQDFDTVYPSIQRLVAVEQDMQDLTRQLGTLLQNEPQSSAVAPGGAGGPIKLLPPPGSSPTATSVPAAPAPVTAVNTAPVPPPAAIPPVAAATPAPVAPAPVVHASKPKKAAAVKTAAAATTGGALHVQALRIGEHPGTTRLVLDVSGKASYTADLDNDEHLLVIQLPGAGWSGAKQGTAPKSPLITSWSVQPDSAGSRLIIQLKKDAKIAYQKAAAGKVIIDIAGG